MKGTEGGVGEGCSIVGTGSGLEMETEGGFLFERLGVRERMVESRGVGSVGRGVEELGGLSKG